MTTLQPPHGAAATPGGARPPPAQLRASQLGDWLRGRLAAGANLCVDSRAVAAGDAFLAYPGGRHDGRTHIAQAVAAGASAVLWDDAAGFGWPAALPTSVAQQGVTGLKSLAGGIAAAYYGHPSARLALVAVTGTNGKTSCTQWIAQGEAATAGPSGAAVIGTLGSGLVDASGPAGTLEGFGLTTPDAVSLQRMLAGFAARGVRCVSIEASSIGLEQGRMDGAAVAVAVFTNLTHDHLDYHGTMQAYADAKARLFAVPGLRAAVVNLDDPASATMLSVLQAAERARGEAAGVTRRIGFGIAGDAVGGIDVDGRLVAEHIEPSADGMRLVVGGDFGRAQLRLRVLGRFNAANALAVAGAWIGLGASFDTAMQRLEALVPVRGRMQRVEPPHATDRAPLAVVDYAHTPDALEKALQTLRPVAEARGGRLWCVFGAGGDRDPAKRPVMGRAAEALADRVVITSDNPRSEVPQKILADIRAGLSAAPWAMEPDRAAAIGAAIAAADAADVVLIAGKGHEDYQEIAGQRLPFSDVQVAADALALKGGARA